MTRWSTLSVRTKLVATTMAVCAVALALMTAGVIGNELVSARAQLSRQLESVADVVGAGSTAAVQFGDRQAATEALSALRADPSIEGARIDLPDGSPFASYGRPLSVAVRALGSEVITTRTSVIVSRPIRLGDNAVSTLRVEGSLRLVRERLQRYAGILAVVIGMALLVGLALAGRLQRSISGPIMHLSKVASEVAESRDYSVRARKEHDDELGRLVDRFNDMLETIALSDTALRQAQSWLEERVAERTYTLEVEVEEHRRTEGQLMLAKSAAEQANVAKSAFLANMSHELRTPLNAIIGYSEMIQEEAEDRGVAESVADLDKVLVAGRHLSSLINNVLDLSKIEAGRMELDLSEFELGEIIRSVIGTSESAAAAHGNTITFDLAGDPGSVRLDRTKVQQVLHNLVGNACKFTENGSVTVRAWSESASGDSVVLEVRDTGIGMTDEQQGRLFQDFTQADSSTTRRYGGTGLGLAISKRLCALMGGTISVGHNDPHGTVFTVRLPKALQTADAGPARRARQNNLPAVAAAAPTSPGEGARPQTILIVDDDASARELVSRVLQRAGYQTITAISAVEAWEELESGTSFSAVVADVILPGKSGWSLLESMKSDARFASLPVVVTSMLDSESDSLNRGALRHLTKPVNGDELVQILAAAAGPVVPDTRPRDARSVDVPRALAS